MKNINIIDSNELVDNYFNNNFSWINKVHGRWVSNNKDELEAITPYITPVPEKVWGYKYSIENDTSTRLDIIASAIAKFKRDNGYTTEIVVNAKIDAYCLLEELKIESEIPDIISKVFGIKYSTEGAVVVIK